MRSSQRLASQFRPLKFFTCVNRYAAGSCRVEWGHTIVLCTASVEEGVPPWRNAQEEGWLTAEYSMLPGSTHSRSRRERTKVSGRTQEIQRLIGRSLRAAVDFKSAPGLTITVDCDVLQADGGTRTASINAAYVALALAEQKLLREGRIREKLIQQQVASVSLGMFGNDLLVDLDYDEDSSADLDSNLVMLSSGEFVEVQATAEGQAISEEKMVQLLRMGREACTEIFTLQTKAVSDGSIVTGDIQLG